MTTQIIFFMIVCCTSSGFLLWCLNGFTRALKQGRKAVGLPVRVAGVDSDGARGKQMPQTPGTTSVISRPRLQMAHPAVVAKRLKAPTVTRAVYELKDQHSVVMCVI